MKNNYWLKVIIGYAAIWILSALLFGFLISIILMALIFLYLHIAWQFEKKKAPKGYRKDLLGSDL